MNPIFKTLSPDWKIPNVKAYTILATDIDSGLVSFSHDNQLARECRIRLEQLVKPAQPIHWLRQVHGNTIVELPFRYDAEADGAYTLQKRTVCAVITADCLPIVFSNQSGTQVGVVHAGRRGLQNGIIAEMFRTFHVPAYEIFAWIGPGIAAESYPVSREIKEEVLDLSKSYENVFYESTQGQYHMDLYEVARMQLIKCGIETSNISGATWNTFSDDRFHSARRDHVRSGRMATVVWME